MRKRIIKSVPQEKTMRKLLVAVVAGVIGVSAGTAQADSLKTTGYVGVNYGVLKQYNRFFDDGKKHFETDKVFIRIGGEINEYFDSELRLGLTAGDKKGRSSISTSSIHADDNITFSHDYLLTLLLKAGYPIGPVKPYAAVGYTFGQERLSYPGGKATARFDDFTFGGGVDISLGSRLVVNAEWIQYDNIDGVRLKGPSAGLAWRF